MDAGSGASLVEDDTLLKRIDGNEYEWEWIHAGYADFPANWKIPEHNWADRNNFDWENEKILIREIYNQKRKKICWVYSSNTNTESTKRIAEYNQGKCLPRVPIQLSMQEPRDCFECTYVIPSNDKSKQPTRKRKRGWQAKEIDGGRSWWTIQYQKEEGISMKSSYPCAVRKNKCKHKKPGSHVVKVGGRIFCSNYGSHPFVLEMLRRQTLVANIPVSPALKALKDDKIYDEEALGRDGDGKLKIPYDEEQHCVMLTGYGNDNGPFFRARNSWGASWGTGGCFRVRPSMVCDVYAVEEVFEEKVRA